LYPENTYEPANHQHDFVFLLGLMAYQSENILIFKIPIYFSTKREKYGADKMLHHFSF